MKYPLLARPSFSALPSALKRSAAVLAAILAASVLTGCERSRTTTYVPGPQPDRFTELEPNDSPDFPDFVGVLDDRSFVVVDGFVEAVGFDIVDHIEFETDRPIEIDFTLEAFGPYADVDVSIYDPIADQIIATYANDGRFEAGTLIIHEPWRPFQFIIEAYVEDAAWSLELIGYPHGCACRTGAPAGDGESGTDHDAEAAAFAESNQAAALPPFRALREHAILRMDPRRDESEPARIEQADA